MTRVRRLCLCLAAGGLLTIPLRAADYRWAAETAEGTTWAEAAGALPTAVLTGRVTMADGRRVVRFEDRRPTLLAGPIGDGWPQLTVSTVVLLEATGGYQGVVCRDRFGGAAGDVFGLLLDPAGNWAARLTTATGAASVTAASTAGWHHLAATYDGARLRLFVDGAARGDQPLGGALAAAPDTPLAVGDYSNGGGRLQGAVSCVHVSDRALSPEDIAADWSDWRQHHPPPSAFTFAAASDIHVTDTRSVEIVNDAVDEINADPRVAFSLWLGDLTQASTADQMVLARLALSRLRRPRYVLRGNHDQSGGFYQREFGPLRQAIEYGGWKFLLADSNPGDATPMSADDLAWLRAELAATDPKTPLVLCTHHPLMPHTRSYRLAGADEVLALFKGYNLKAALSGHYHGNQSEVVDGVLFTTTACLATTRENFDGTKAKGYRLFHCRDGQITTEFVTVAEGAEPAEK